MGGAAVTLWREQEGLDIPAFLGGGDCRCVFSCSLLDF